LPSKQATLISALRTWWREQPEYDGARLRLRRLADILREFIRDSMPDRKRQHFGDAEYDWEFRVDTTSANVGWRARFIGLLNSSYQPIEPEIFREMMDRVAIDFTQFTFVDIGSGKGRALLLASEFPFRRLIGIELLPELNRIAQENIRKFSTTGEDPPPTESICGDATEFEFPHEPLVVFLFHPLTEAGFRKVLANLEVSLRQVPREAYIVYANPIFEMILAAVNKIKKVGGTRLYVIYRAVEESV
jgi:SAM-dependent methyltransferase